MSDILVLVAEAQKRFDALSPKQKAEHRRKQRESFIRGMTARCEHDAIDFEQCPECMKPHRKAQP